MDCELCRHEFEKKRSPPELDFLDKCGDFFTAFCLEAKCGSCEIRPKSGLASDCMVFKMQKKIVEKINERLDERLGKKDE